MVFGALGGMGAACFCHPLDVIRVQMQVDPTAGNPLVTGMNIFKRGGLSTLYSGIDAAFLRQWTYGSCRVGIYSYLLSNAQQQGSVSFQTKLGIGCTAGAIGSFVGTPSELALVRMSADSSLAPELRRNYKNVVDCCMRIIKEEGIASLWKGSTPTIVRATSLSGATLGCYSESKERLTEYFPQYFGKDSGPTWLVSTLFASFVATTVSTPFDVVKSRIQNMPTPKTGEKPLYSGMLNCFATSIKAEGPLVVFKGFIPAFLKLTPYNIISLTLTEGLMTIYTGKAAF